MGWACNCVCLMVELVFSLPRLKIGPTKTTFIIRLFDVLWCDRLALEEGDVSVFLESEEEEPRLTSSLLTIPTYIKV